MIRDPRTGVVHPDGAAPAGGLTVASSGDLFGTAAFGGGNDIDPYQDGGGVLFELNSTSLNVLHSFCALANCDGYYPEAGVLQNANGTLFGTTVLGGTSGTDGGGTVFKLRP